MPGGHPRAFGNALPAAHAAAYRLTTVLYGIAATNPLQRQQQQRQKQNITQTQQKHYEGGIGKMDPQLRTNQANAAATSRARDRHNGKQARKQTKQSDGQRDKRET